MKASCLPCCWGTRLGVVIPKSPQRNVNKDLPLKPWNQNRLNEILRFTVPENWRLINSNMMIADLGTRKGVKLDEVGPKSAWHCGFGWMKLEIEQFPTRKIGEIKLLLKEAGEDKLTGEDKQKVHSYF